MKLLESDRLELNSIARGLPLKDTYQQRVILDAQKFYPRHLSAKVQDFTNICEKKNIVLLEPKMLTPIIYSGIKQAN